ncbi:MAG: ATPase [Ignavibacteria bacterium GWB2_35_12]|nr:MAG: ATPase [Ignavibacteria bacterium GWA2_35_8]OGU38049.1 MAG: ATPase [Ignavibacteria bacterium GWB2_35_12]OGU87483.1 MAG: ATPase [Ignavibacteria bacterium RIFOXYA2_FULL_35_10]OGV25029.1 MAG: ATPase [Ignavibacteria bacterium RIFOXYC2_FULL_35_21]
MIIQRNIEKIIFRNLVSNKVVVIAGARRTGKTVLLKESIKKVNEPYLFLNGEDIATHELLFRRSVINYKNLMGDVRLLIIDEAQKINDIGLILKLMVDEIEGMKIIVTGSSSFDISNRLGEPLTGRKITYHLYPFSESELMQIETKITKPENLRDRLVYGNYPELTFLNGRENKEKYLKELINSYLLKDKLSYENIRSSAKIIELLKLISFQVGSEVSNNELSRQLSISKTTVEKYLDLLTKVFILHKLSGFSRNLRKEVTKSSKWYFYDNGIRNGIINNFSQLSQRNDIGKLWENYIISERLKYQNDKQYYSNNYFWRTYDKQEIDWIEEKDGNLSAYELKWAEKKIKPPDGWLNSYPDSHFKVIHSDNYFNWVK